MSRVILLTGVSGAGKSTIGRRLASRLGWEFHDADSFHPPENIDKMRRGIPLDDRDRTPWLDAIRRQLQEQLADERPAVITCSALKAAYRRHLTEGLRGVIMVHLSGSFEVIKERIEKRRGHYMKAQLLKSQFEALEPPDDAHVVSVEGSVDDAVDAILGLLEEAAERSRKHV